MSATACTCERPIVMGPAERQWCQACRRPLAVTRVIVGGALVAEIREIDPLIIQPANASGPPEVS